MNERQLYYIQADIDKHNQYISNVLDEWRNNTNELCEYADELEAYKIIVAELTNLLEQHT